MEEAAGHSLPSFIPSGSTPDGLRAHQAAHLSFSVMSLNGDKLDASRYSGPKGLEPSAVQMAKNEPQTSGSPRAPPLDSFRSIEQQLAALREMPAQLIAILDSLNALNARLGAGAVAQPRASEDTKPIVMHEPAKALAPREQGLVYRAPLQVDGMRIPLQAALRRASHNREDNAGSTSNNIASQPLGPTRFSAPSLATPTSREDDRCGCPSSPTESSSRSNLSVAVEFKQHINQRRMSGASITSAASIDERRPVAPAEHESLLRKGFAGVCEVQHSHSSKSVPENASEGSSTSSDSEAVVPPGRIVSNSKMDEIDGRTSSRHSIAQDFHLSLGAAKLRREPTFTDWTSEDDQKSTHWSACVLLPRSKVLFVWECLLASAIFLTAILWPIQHVYFRAAQSETLSNALYVTDGIWILGMLINFRTAFRQDGRLVVDSRRMFCRYARGWLGLDLLAAWPTAVLPSTGPSSALFLLKWLRLLKLKPIFDSLQEKFSNVSFLPVRVCIAMILSPHLLACVWRVAIEADVPEERSTTRWQDSYVADIYWVSMTMTTVGYGDIFPQGTKSRLYACFVMSVAPFFSGAIVSLLTHATKNVFNDEISERIAGATRFMARRHVPSEIQRRVEKNLRHNLETPKLDPGLYAIMSPAVQRELSLALLGRTITQFPLFKDARRAVVAELAQAHIWVQCSPDDVVAEEGQLMQELVFIISGRFMMETFSLNDCEVSLGETPPADELELHQDSWFGERCLFHSNAVHTHTITTIVASEIAALPASEYHRIVKKFPRVMQMHAALQKLVEKSETNLKQLEHRASTSSPPTKGRESRWTTLFARQGSMLSMGSLHPFANPRPSQ